MKNPQLNVDNDIGWLFGLQVLLRKSQKCKSKFSQKLFRETLMALDTDPILAYGFVVQKTSSTVDFQSGRSTITDNFPYQINIKVKALYFDVGRFHQTFTTEAAG